jgi:DNA anti-recombination protein RmuC
MSETILDLIMNGSPMVAFAAYLLWSNHRSEKKLESQHEQFFAKPNHRSEKKLESQHEQFFAKLDALEDKHERVQDQTRERWMAVVEKLEAERSQSLNQLSNQHERIIVILESIGKDKS